MKATEQDVVLPMKISFATDPALLKDAVTTIGLAADNDDDVLVRLSSRQMRIMLTDAIEVVVTIPLKRPIGLSEDGNLELQISIKAFAGLDDLAESDKDIEFSIPHFKPAVGDEGRIEIRTGATTIVWFYVLLGGDITPAASKAIHSLPVNTDALRRSLQLVRSFAKKSDTNPIFSIMSVSDSAALAGAASSVRTVQMDALVEVDFRVEHAHSKRAIALLGRFTGQSVTLTSDGGHQIISNDHLSCSIPIAGKGSQWPGRGNSSAEIKLQAFDLANRISRIFAQTKHGRAKPDKSEITLSLKDARTITFATPVNGGTAIVECPILELGDEAEVGATDVSISAAGLSSFSAVGDQAISMKIFKSAVLFEQNIQGGNVSTLVVANRRAL
jgi:hypothetical protein